MTKARDLANASTALSAVSATELGYVDGVTSAIQTQIDAKAPSSTAVTLTGTQTLTNKTLTSPALTTPTISTATTNGDILYGTGSGALARLGIGTTGQVLNVAAGLPAWATPASGSTFVGCFASSRAAQSIANATFAAIALATEAYDTSSIHTTGGNNTRFTIPSGKGGYWLFYAALGYDPLSSGNMNIRFYKNNSSTVGGILYTGATSASTLTTGTLISILSLDAADYIELVAYQNSGGSASILVAGGEDFAFMGCQYLGA